LTPRQALALGLLQGPTELLPVSSSAHTTLIRVPARYWPSRRARRTAKSEQLRAISVVCADDETGSSSVGPCSSPSASAWRGVNAARVPLATIAASAGVVEDAGAVARLDRLGGLNGIVAPASAKNEVGDAITIRATTT